MLCLKNIFVHNSIITSFFLRKEFVNKFTSKVHCLLNTEADVPDCFSSNEKYT
jgi:hypothetical protein